MMLKMVISTRENEKLTYKLIIAREGLSEKALKFTFTGAKLSDSLAPRSINF